MKATSSIELLSTSQAAEYLGVHVQTLKNWLRAGRLAPDARIGGNFGFSRARLDAAAANRPKLGKPFQEKNSRKKLEKSCSAP